MGVRSSPHTIRIESIADIGGGEVCCCCVLLLLLLLLFYFL